MPMSNNQTISPALMSIVEHIQELRRRIIVSLISILIASVVSFFFYDQIISIFYNPFRNIPSFNQNEVLFVNTVFEGFLIKLKVSILSGIVFSFPVHVYNLIRFIFPGLKKKERQIISISLIVSFILIISSGYYGYFKVIPITLRFLTDSGFIPSGVGILLNFGKNIFYIFQYLLVSLLLFQLPIILEILIILKVLRIGMLLRISKFVIVGIFIISALVTPPDFISQISIALPLITLYFLTILIAKIFRFGDK